MSAANKRMRATPERRAWISAVMRLKWKDPAFREARVNALKRRFADPELRARISAAQKLLWEDPAYRARATAARRARCAT